MFYNLNKSVVLQVDASDDGLGGVLLHVNDDGNLQPVAFTSCSLNPTERCYSQIEKERLAICDCFNKYDHWLYDKTDVHVHTDHQPLETTHGKDLNKAPVRLQKMMIKLQRYTLGVTYKRDSSLCVADTLSRAALSTPMEAKVTGFEVFRLRLELDDLQPNARLKPATEVRLLKRNTE